MVSVSVSASPSTVNGRSYATSAMLQKEYPEHTLYPMPALSPTMESGTISSWTKTEGEEFSAGDVLCSIETDKASVDFEAQDDGILAKILKDGPNARELPVGTPICVVVEEPDDVAAFADFVAGDGAASASEAATPAAEPSSTAASTSPVGAGAPTGSASVPNRTVADEFVLMPSARHLAQSRGVDATVLTGTGKGGRVTKGDVLAAIANGVEMPSLSSAATDAAVGAASTAPPPAAATTPQPRPLADLVDLPVPEADYHGTYEDVPNNNMRKVIAKRLAASKGQVPHFYSSIEVELDNVLALRKSLVKNHDVKVSVNDLVIRCSALALRDVPEVNGTYDEKSGMVKKQESIDISVAVATPTGLITPIVPNTDKLGLSEITASVRDLAGRAREGKLAPNEYQGGTFCISNLGMFGIDEFSAVINPPQAAILAVGGGSARVVPTPYVDGAAEQEKPTIRTIMTARLSADRRVVDEATAALFLSAFKHYLNKPELLLL